MPLVPKLVLGLYLLFLLAAGWRLGSIGWTIRVKLATALALAVPVPLLFIIPALMRDSAWSDLLIRFGLTLLVCGVLCLAGGFSAARLRARRS
ncbi:hypothetical protein WG907_02740 [Sphingobium sp. AN558]|uniref:hypothetical protein n=1 Tax=Sphingobium sp. AN558 TaxID=3133442 RepID=UPI0030BF8A4D